jgi:hypothetical protein
VLFKGVYPNNAEEWEVKMIQMVILNVTKIEIIVLAS